MKIGCLRKPLFRFLFRSAPQLTRSCRPRDSRTQERPGNTYISPCHVRKIHLPSLHWTDSPRQLSQDRWTLEATTRRETSGEKVRSQVKKGRFSPFCYSFLSATWSVVAGEVGQPAENASSPSTTFLHDSLPTLLLTFNNVICREPRRTTLRITPSRQSRASNDHERNLQ